MLGKDWGAAGDLFAGDEIYLLDGATAVITGSELDKRGINYEIIKVESNYPKAGIFSDKYRGIIGETGYHYGVKIGDMVYDNLTTQGMNFVDWINDLGGRQYIHW